MKKILVGLVIVAGSVMGTGVVDAYASCPGGVAGAFCKVMPPPPPPPCTNISCRNDKL